MIFDEYHDAIRRGIPVTDAMAKELADAVKGVKNYTNTLNYSVKQLGQATKQAAQDIANGAKGTSVFNSSIERAGDVAGNVASQFGLLGKGLGLAINALTAWITAVNKQSDALYSNFQQLSRSGVIGAQGMDDVFQSMRRFGYTIDELDKMSAMLAENSREFAMFSGTAATGSKQVSNLVMGMEDARVKFFNMGMTVDDISRATAGYYRQLSRNGKLQEATSAGAQAYIKEMETLTRLTGVQRKEIEDQRQAAEDIDQFYAGLMEMDPAAAKNAYSVFTQLMAVDPSGKKARAFAVSMDGIIGGSEDQMQAIMSTNAQFLDLSMAVKQGKIDAAQFMQGYSDAIRPNIELQKQLAKVGVTDFMGGLKNNVMLANKGLVPFAKQLGLSEKEIADLEAGVNGATAAQSQARDSQIRASQNVQDFINTGINPLTKAMKILTDVVESLTSLLPGSGRAKERYEREQKEAAAASAAKVSGGILDKIIQAESGGRNIGTTGSSAFGIAQMTKGTFEGLAKKATPGSALYGKTFEDMKADVGLQRQALSQLTTENQAALSKAGVATNDAATYLAHFLGSSGAVRVLQASDQTPVSSVVSNSAIAANPAVFNNIATAGDLKAWAQKKMGSAGPSGAFGFRGTVSGPMSGYSPNLLMHGTEELSIKPSTGAPGADNASATEGSIMTLISKVEELVDVGKAQLSTSERILKYQR